MNLRKITIAIGVALLLLACNSKQNKLSENKPTDQVQVSSQNDTLINIPYILADNYFVKNNVKKVDSKKIESENIFNEIFGAATHMGTNGKPTSINFTTQFVIPIVLDETDVNTTIVPKSLSKKNKDEIVFSYSVKKGGKMTSTMRPSAIIVVDKKYDGDVLIHVE